MRLLLFALLASSLAVAEDAARQIAAELNLLRSNPAAYSRHIEARLPLYKGNILRLPRQIGIRTREGAAAAREAVAALRSTGPLGNLAFAPGLARAAADHVEDIGPKGLTSHEGSRGVTMDDRIARYARDYSYIGETISFGPSEARDVIIDLLVDDGVPGRGHRKILLDGKFRYVGAACGPHTVYRTMCVLNFAQRWQEKK
jgi:uncharacterized protein YkwD